MQMVLDKSVQESFTFYGIVNWYMIIMVLVAVGKSTVVTVARGTNIQVNISVGANRSQHIMFVTNSAAYNACIWYDNLGVEGQIIHIHGFIPLDVAIPHI